MAQLALPLLAGATALAPDWAPIHAAHANVLHRLGRTAEAAGVYRLALAREPENGPLWVNLARACQQAERQWDEAAMAYGRAAILNTDPDESPSHHVYLTR